MTDEVIGTAGSTAGVIRRALAEETLRGFDAIARLASRAVGSAVGLVSIVDAEGQVFPGAVGLPDPWQSTRQTPLSHSFCQHVVSGREDLVITHAREHALVASNLAIRDLGVIAYAGVPLRTIDGTVVGSVCAIEGQPRVWRGDDLAILRDAAELATRELRLRELQEQQLDRAELFDVSPTSGDEHTSPALSVINRLLGELTSTAEHTRELQIRRAQILAHELNTPLIAARMLCEDLDEDTGRAHSEQLAQIRRCASEALELIEAEVVEASTPRRTEPRTEPVDLDVLFQSLGAMMRPLTPPGVSLHFDPPARDAARVLTDPVKLAQVLRNLIANAIRVTTEGEVRLSTAAHGTVLYITVADTGPGIEAGVIDRIFDEGISGARPGRLGLGLPLSRSIMRDLGGDLIATSSPGHGATFHATLPTTPAP